MYDVRDATIVQDLSIEEVGRRIRIAARVQDWEVEELEPLVILISKSHTKHGATSTVRYDRNSFSIELRGSHNFKEGEGRIHKLYNQWIRDLERGIHRELSLAADR